MRIADALLVPHQDDEVVFLWSQLADAQLCGVLCEAGYTRSMEGWIGLQQRFPQLRVVRYRVLEPLPARPSWGVVPGVLALWDVTNTIVALYEQMVAGGLHTLAIPGDTAVYGHPHHIQLQEVLDDIASKEDLRLRFVQETEVALPSLEAWRKHDAAMTMYASEREAWCRDGAVIDRLEAGTDWVRTYVVY